MKKNPATSFAVALGAVFVLAGQLPAVTVTVNPSTTYQTMDGIGAFWGMPVLYRPAGAFWADRPQTYDYDRFATDLGASLVRFEVPATACYPVQGQPYDWTPVFNTINGMRQLKARGVDRFILTVWSPPAWMKYSKVEIGVPGSSLDPQYEAGYATFLADFCAMIKDSIGGTAPYALSIQNEPKFYEPYASNMMDQNQMSRMIDLVQPRFTAKGLTTKFFGPEDMLGFGFGDWGAVLANANLYAAAVHGYTNGVTPDLGNDATWAARKADVGSKRLWMTESTGDGRTVLNAAQCLFMAIASGSVSGWTWWSYADNVGTYGQTSGINTTWSPGGVYYGTKHFARFARPGAVRLGCTSGANNIWAMAFKNPDNTYAVVIVNSSGAAATVDVSGVGLPTSWNKYQSGGGSNCVAGGTTNGTGIALPADGVISLLSGNPAPVLGADTTANSLPSPPQDNTIGLMNGYGDDMISLWLNGVHVPNVTGNQNLVKQKVSIKQGDNIVAVYVQNIAWGGGLLASMLIPPKTGSTVPETLRTDGTWKVTYKDPTANTAWNSLTYDDSKWEFAKDVGQANIWPGFASWGSSAVNMYYQKARWILGGAKCGRRRGYEVNQPV